MRRVLIVDDQADIRRLIRWTLEEEPCLETKEVSNGAAALETASRWRPHLVILDVMFPGELTGLDVCAQLKQGPRSISTKVLLISALAGSQDINAGDAAGADVYMPKPFKPTELIRQVRRLLPYPG